MLVRRERLSDVVPIREVVAAAFRRDDRVPAEVGLIDELRSDAGWVPALSLVAEDPDAGDVIGHVVCTRGEVDGHHALGLGPLAVRPDRQRRGVGQALVHAVLGAADALDQSCVVLLGSPPFYRRFGFRPALELGVKAPDPTWGPYFQIRTLTAFTALNGTFRYAEPFSRL